RGALAMRAATAQVLSRPVRPLARVGWPSAPPALREWSPSLPANPIAIRLLSPIQEFSCASSARPSSIVHSEEEQILSEESKLPVLDAKISCAPSLQVQQTATDGVHAKNQPCHHQQTFRCLETFFVTKPD